MVTYLMQNDGTELIFSRYYFSDDGTLFSEKGRAIKLQQDENGRRTASLRDDAGKQRTVIFSRLKYINFNDGKMDDYHNDIDHIDGNPDNDELDNLQEITQNHNRTKKNNPDLTYNDDDDNDEDEYFTAEINGRLERFTLEKRTDKAAKPAPAITERQRLLEMVTDWKNNNSAEIKRWIMERENITNADLTFPAIKKALELIYKTLDWTDLWAWILHKYNEAARDRDNAKKAMEQAKQDLRTAREPSDNLDNDYLTFQNVIDKWTAPDGTIYRLDNPGRIKEYFRTVLTAEQTGKPWMDRIINRNKKFLQEIFNHKFIILTREDDNGILTGRPWTGSDNLDEIKTIYRTLRDNGLEPYIFTFQDLKDITEIMDIREITTEPGEPAEGERSEPITQDNDNLDELDEQDWKIFSED